MFASSTKRCVAAIAAAALALTLPALASARPNHSSPRDESRAAALQLKRDGIDFVAQLVEGFVKPDLALKTSWHDELTAMATSMRMGRSALVDDLVKGRSLDQIAARQGVSVKVPERAFLDQLARDLRRAEGDGAMSRAAANDLLGAVSLGLGRLGHR
jgi:hypothetical protein